MAITLAVPILTFLAGGASGFFLRRAGRWSVLVPLALVLLHLWCSHRGLVSLATDRSLFALVVGLVAGWMWKEHRLRRREPVNPRA